MPQTKEGEDIRKIKIFKRKFFRSPPPETITKRATTPSEILDALRLVHDVYVANGFITPTRTGLKVTPWDTDPNSATFIALKGSEITNVLGYIPDSTDLGLPAERTFPHEIATLRQKGTACEFTNLAVTNGAQEAGVLTELMKCPFSYAHLQNYRYVVGMVSPGIQEEFYAANTFTRQGPIKAPYNNPDDKVVLMVLDLKNLEQRLVQIDRKRRRKGGEDAVFLQEHWYEKNTLLRKDYPTTLQRWEDQARTAYLDPALCKALVFESGIEEKYDPSIFKAVKSRWDQEVLRTAESLSEKVTEPIS